MTPLFKKLHLIFHVEDNDWWKLSIGTVLLKWFFALVCLVYTHQKGLKLINNPWKFKGYYQQMKYFNFYEPVKVYHPSILLTFAYISNQVELTI